MGAVTAWEREVLRLAAHYQQEELADDTDSMAAWIDHICDEHPRQHVDWIRPLIGTR